MALETTMGDGEWVETTDEEGVIHYFEKLQELEIEDQEYALLIYHGTQEEIEAKAKEKDSDTASNGKSTASSTEEDEEGYEEEIILMRMVMEENTYVYESIDDEKEFNRVLGIIETMDLDGLEDAEDEAEES